jgi:hypothetical protein
VTAVDRSLTTGGRGRGRSASRLAWLLYVLALALVALAAGLWLVVHRPVPGAVGYEYWREGVVTTLAYATVGALITTRRPAHPVGWLFLGAGLVGAAQLATGEFAAAFLAASGPSVAVAVAAWASSLFQLVVVGLLVCLLLLFPTGRPPSRRWWVLVWVVAAGVVLFSVGAGLAPARYQDFPGVENPFGIAGLATVLGWVDGVGGILFVAGLLGALASLVVRFTRARDLERQQLKWFVYAAGLGVAVVVLPIPIPGFLVWTLAPVGLSAAAAVAVLRYRLYDIDRIINRTLVYGLLTAILGLGYAAGSLIFILVTGVGSVGSGPPSWLVAAVTLAAAAVFRPARHRIQSAVDRRFNRRKYHAATTIQAFTTRLSEQIDLDTLSTELLAVVDQTMEPTRVSLWLRPSPHGSSDTSRSQARPARWVY